MSIEDCLVAVCFTHDELRPQAQQLASELNIKLIAKPSKAYHYYLMLTPERLELRQYNQRTRIYVEFLRGEAAYRRFHGGGLQQLIARACGIKQNYQPKIIDATAGLGRDAFVLACLGCCVLMIERSPVIAALLRDGLVRLHADAKLARQINLKLVQGDSYTYISQLPVSERPDVIYLDPMYLAHPKSALVKQEMRILGDLVSAKQNSLELLNCSRAIAKRRVVVKRAKWLAPLTQSPPDIGYRGRSTRFDVYLSHTE